MAVVLDRISQTEATDSENLFKRIRRAWAHRRDPEVLLPEAATIGVAAKTRSQAAPLTSGEHRGLIIVAVSALIAVVAVFLPWGHDSGRISGYARLVDTGRYENVEIDPERSPGIFEIREASLDPPAEHVQEITVLEAQRQAAITAAGAELVTDSEVLSVITDIDDEIARLSNPLEGRSFNGLSASGGSFYGILVLGFALLLLLAVVSNLRRPGGGVRLFGSNGVLALAFGLLAAVVAYLWAAPATANVSHSVGVGPWIAAIAGALAIVGAALWLKVAPYSARRPLKASVSYAHVGVAVLVVILLVISGFSGWSFDQRVESVVSPELAAQIEALEQQVSDDPSANARIANEITALYSKAQRTQTRVIDGFSGDGSRYGYLGLVLAILGVALTLPAAGVFGADERRRRRWNAAVAGVGLGLMVVSVAWISSLLRVADPRFSSGAGSFICLLAGFLLMASTAGVLKEFDRSEVYVAVDDPEVVPEKAGVAAV